MENLELFYAGIDLMADLFDIEYISILHLAEEDSPKDYKAVFVLNRPNIDAELLKELDESYDDPNLKQTKPPEDKEQVDDWLQEQSFAYKFFVYMGMLSAATEDGLGFYEQKDLDSIPDEYNDAKCYILLYDTNWEASPEDFQEFEDFSFEEV